MKVVLIILDGWGLGQSWGGNAITLAKTKTMDFLSANYPFATLEASQEAVGLPFKEPGNSEVGHLNIGSGQIVYQGFSAINQTLKDGSFFKNQILKEAMLHVHKHKTTLHFVGLVSDGGIHSHLFHLFALLKLAKKYKLKNVLVHAITDGRDSAPTSGINYVKQLEEKIKELNVGKIATVSGRYYAMDRDNHFDRTEKVYNALVLGKGEQAKSASAAILKSYADGTTDEFILPTNIGQGGTIKDGDSIIFFNFRSDRMRQLVRSLVKQDFNGFKRKRVLKNLNVATFATYQEGLPVSVVFENKKVSSVLSAILTQNNLTHLHIAETEKYPHVTYFFNGGEEKPFEGEERILVPSPHVPTYDLKPEMSAAKISQRAISRLAQFDFTVLNFANPDMVGHTGNLKAAVKAIETVDGCLGKLVKKTLSLKTTAIITADHGNAEQMINPKTGEIDTEHTTNPVPFIIVSKKKMKVAKEGRLCDIAPTILELFGLKRPKEMLGQSLLRT